MNTIVIKTTESRTISVSLTKEGPVILDHWGRSDALPPREYGLNIPLTPTPIWSATNSLITLTPNGLSCTITAGLITGETIVSCTVINPAVVFSTRFVIQQIETIKEHMEVSPPSI